jgi:hypothetical protein
MSNDSSGTPAAESLSVEPRQSRTLTALVYQPYETGRLAYQFWRRSAIKLVRCSAVSFALQQMNAGESVAMLRPQLQELWRKGTLVASIAYVLARETR